MIPKHRDKGRSLLLAEPAYVGARQWWGVAVRPEPCRGRKLDAGRVDDGIEAEEFENRRRTSGWLFLFHFSRPLFIRFRLAWPRQSMAVQRSTRGLSVGRRHRVESAHVEQAIGGTDRSLQLA